MIFQTRSLKYNCYTQFISLKMINKKLGPLKKPDGLRSFYNERDDLISSLRDQLRQTNKLLHQKKIIVQTKQDIDSLTPKQPALNGNTKQEDSHQQIQKPNMSASNIMSEVDHQNKSMYQQQSRIQSDDRIVNKLDQMINRLDKFMNFVQKSNGNFQNAKSERSISSKQKQDILLPKQVQQSLKKIKTVDEKKKKEKYNVLSEILPYSDRRQFKVKIQLEEVARQFPVIKSLDDLEHITTQWTGQVFRMVASVCWNMMLNGFLSFQETKILFTENVIFNFIEYMKELEQLGFGQHRYHLTAVISQKSVQVLEFLGKQYPQTKIQSPNIRLRETVPSVNNANRMKFDVITLANHRGWTLKYSKTANYSEEVMQLINFMIDKTNQQYNAYEKHCLEIFQQIYILPTKRKSAREIQQQEVSLNIQNQSTQDIIYREKAKKYTKFLIGRKINKNVPKYTRQQIQNGLFVPKSSSILRIITKWLEQLMEVINDPYLHIFTADRQLKSHGGKFLVLFSVVRKGVCEEILKRRQTLYDKIKKIKYECYAMESKLASSKYTEDSSQTHLSVDQISVGKFSSYLQKALSAYMFQQLNQVLHFLLEIPSHVDQTKIGIDNEFYQSQARGQLDRLNLVTLKIFDLLRCKCISNQEQIIWIMNHLKERNHIREFKLVRVKDRLGQGTRDINCNVRFFRGGFLSQMQLSVVSNIQKKQQQLDSYNHFIYELKRSKLGPISENVSIWTVLQQRSLYFQTIARNPIPEKLQNHECSRDQLIKFIRPITCQSCDNFYPWPQTCVLNFICKKCQKCFCGQCFIKGISQDQVQSIVFDGLFKMSIQQEILYHSSHKQPFPKKGIYIKKYHERKEINFFTILLREKNISKRIITDEDIQKNKNSQTAEQLDCQIIFIHNVVRNGKVIQKQKNHHQKTYAKLIKGQIYIEQNSYNFFSTNFIFGFSSKWSEQVLTLDQMQEYLSKQENYRIKVLSIIQEPVYVSTIMYMKKKSDKLRQLYRLKNLFPSKQTKILVYKYKNIWILAKNHKTTEELATSIKYSNNVTTLKYFATNQVSNISLERKNILNEINNLKQDIGHKLYRSMTLNLRKIYLNYNILESVEGLKQFTLLQVIYLRHNKLKSLNGLQNLKELVVLRFDDNLVSDITALQYTTGLKRLMGNGNKIESIEVLKNLRQLRTIEFQWNLLTSIEPIKDLSLLQELNFKSNVGIIDLPVIASKNLRYISLSKTGISQNDLEKLSNYPKMQRLLLEQLKLTEIPSFIDKLDLQQLWLGENEITEVKNLENQHNLKIVSFKRNKLKKISGLSNLHNLKTLYLQRNEIQSLQELKPIMDTLKYLNIKRNPLNDCSTLVYMDEAMKIDYTLEEMTEKGKNDINEILLSRAVSSGSEDG